MTTPSTIACYAKLLGPSNATFYLTRPRATLGRKVSYPEGTLYDTGEKVPIADFFVGESSNISRIHCVLQYSVGVGAAVSHYEVVCCSKNGMAVDGCYIGKNDGPHVLRSRSLLMIGDAFWYFLLPRDTSKYSDALIRPPAVAYVPIPLITRSSRIDEEERERQRDEQRKKERDDKQRMQLEAKPASATSPSPFSHSPTPAAVKHAPPPPAPPIDTWARTEREVLKDAVLMFPVARTDVLQDELRKEGVRKSDAEVDVFVSTFIAALMKNAGPSLTKSLRQLSPSSAQLIFPASASARPPPPTPLLFSLVTWNIMTKNAKHWARRLLQLHALHQHMSSKGSLHLLDDLLSHPRGRLPAVWWSRRCDIDLLIGIYKHGYGRFDRIRDDKTLVFAAIMQQVTKQAKEGADKAEAKDDDDAEGGEDSEAGEDGEDEEADEDVDDVDSDEEDGEGGDSSASSSSDKPRRKASKSKPAAAAAPSTITVTPVVSPPPFTRTLFGPVSKGKTEDGWPISLALVGRFRQLLKVMRMRDLKAAEDRKRKAPDGGVAAGGGGKRQKVIDGFNDDERSVFTKALLITGAPASPAAAASSWASMRAGWPLLVNKRDEELAQRMEAMKKEANTLLAPLSERLLLAGSHRETLSLLSSLFTGPSSASLPSVLTPVLSSHLLSHIHYFAVSRTALASLPTALPAPPPPSHSFPLPSWWKLSTHDRYLVLGINKHGLRLRAIDDDIAYPFKLYGGLDGWLREVGAGRGMEALVVRWKQLVDRWRDRDDRGDAAAPSTGSTKRATPHARSGSRPA